MAKQNQFAGLKPLFTKTVAPAPEKPEPVLPISPKVRTPRSSKEPLPSRTYIYPVYEDSVFFRSRDCNWSGTNACIVRSDVRELDPKFSNIVDVMSKVMSVCSGNPVEWSKLDLHIPYTFVSSITGTPTSRTVVFYRNSAGDVLAVDDTAGPPPDKLYGDKGEMTPGALVDAAKASDVCLLIAPVRHPSTTVDPEESMTLVYELVRQGRLASASVAAVVYALMDEPTFPKRDRVHEMVLPATGPEPTDFTEARSKIRGDISVEEATDLFNSLHRAVTG